MIANKNLNVVRCILFIHILIIYSFATCMIVGATGFSGFRGRTGVSGVTGAVVIGSFMFCLFGLVNETAKHFVVVVAQVVVVSLVVGLVTSVILNE